MPNCPNCGIWCGMVFVSALGNGCFKCGCIFDDRGNVVDYDDRRAHDWEQAYGRQRKMRGNLGGVDDYTRKREDAILQAVADGDRLRAMKLYRELYDASLKEAKKFVDDIGKKWFGSGGARSHKTLERAAHLITQSSGKFSFCMDNLLQSKCSAAWEISFCLERLHLVN